MPGDDSCVRQSGLVYENTLNMATEHQKPPEGDPGTLPWAWSQGFSLAALPDKLSHEMNQEFWVGFYSLTWEV